MMRKQGNPKAFFVMQDDIDGGLCNVVLHIRK
jgi:hypothetical protein